MFSLFSKKKKFKANCDLSGQPLEKESAYLISTAQIISSRKFWDNKMTEPDTLTYTQAHFKSGDPTARNIRNMIFKKYSSIDKVWVISDAQIHLFDIDETESKMAANQWWDSEGATIPVDLSGSLTKLGADKLGDFEKYAVQEAGRHLVKI